MTTRDGTSTILLYPSGVFIDPMNPDPAKIHVEDIAHHLSVIPRFGGGTAVPYMVAQHCVLVSRIIGHSRFPVTLLANVPPGGARRWALYGLLHEVAEACSGFGDVLAPVKRLPHVAAIVKPIERAIEAAAAKARGFPEDFASLPVVKWADRFVLDWEDRDLRDEAVPGAPNHLGSPAPDGGARWEHTNDARLPEEKIVALPWQEVKALFLDRYRELTR